MEKEAIIPAPSSENATTDSHFAGRSDCLLPSLLAVGDEEAAQARAHLLEGGGRRRAAQAHIEDLDVLGVDAPVDPGHEVAPLAPPVAVEHLYRGIAPQRGHSDHAYLVREAAEQPWPWVLPIEVGGARLAAEGSSSQVGGWR